MRVVAAVDERRPTKLVRRPAPGLHVGARCLTARRSSDERCEFGGVVPKTRPRHNATTFGTPDSLAA